MKRLRNRRIDTGMRPPRKPYCIVMLASAAFIGAVYAAAKVLENSR